MLSLPWELDSTVTHLASGRDREVEFNSQRGRMPTKKCMNRVPVAAVAVAVARVEARIQSFLQRTGRATRRGYLAQRRHPKKSLG